MAKGKRAKVNISSAVKRNAKSVSVDSLQVQGVKKINVIGLSKINKLISDAVDKTLEKYQQDWSDEQAQEIKRGAQAEFMDLLELHQKTKDEKAQIEAQKDLLDEEVQKLRDMIATGASALEEERQREFDRTSFTMSQEGLDELQKKIKRIVSGVIDDERRIRVAEEGPGCLPDLKKFEAALHDIVGGVLERERTLAAEREKAASSENVQLLERRLAKLQQSLDKSEDALRKMAKMKNIDEGTASIYGDIQGLSLEEAQYERKKEMLKFIFEDNLKLQKEKAAS
jgi:hypothetical protein